MNKWPVIIFLLIAPIFTIAQTTETDTVYSKHVKDNFVITIRRPAAFDLKKKYHHVYITDGSIGIGDYILGKDKSWAATIPSSCVIIAISHVGDWESKRARDFIPSDISKNSENYFGKADSFYLFLKTELIPMVEKKLTNKKDRVFIGHSFGGLFCLYILFKDDKLFDKHFAISPSVWANYYELDKIEEKFSKTNTALKANVTLFAGTLEFLNKVLSSTRSFYQTMQKRKYYGMIIQKNEINYANHFSIRKPAVDKIFESLKDQ